MIREEMLINLREAIENKMNELEDDFWCNKELPCFIYDGISIINPFFSECFDFEIENPIEYYKITNEDIEKFFEYYLEGSKKEGYHEKMCKLP